MKMSSHHDAKPEDQKRADEQRCPATCARCRFARASTDGTSRFDQLAVRPLDGDVWHVKTVPTCHEHQPQVTKRSAACNKLLEPAGRQTIACRYR